MPTIKVRCWTMALEPERPVLKIARKRISTTGSSITLNATGAGNLCARLYDVGFVTTPVLYTMQITHP